MDYTNFVMMLLVLLLLNPEYRSGQSFVHSYAYVVGTYRLSLIHI